MNLWKTAGLLAVFAILLWWVLTNENEPPPDETADRQVVQLLGLDSIDEVSEITVQRPEGTFTVRRTDSGDEFSSGAWQLTAPFTEECDSAATSYLDTLLTTKARYSYSGESAKELSDERSGLNEPTCSLTVADADGNRKTIHFGGKAPNDGGYYARVEGDSRVLIFFTYYVDTNLIEKKIGDLRNKDLLRFATGDVKSIKLIYQGSEVQLTRDDEGWQIDGDKPLRADTAVVDSLLSSLSSARIDEFVDDDEADLATFGLDEPRLRVVLGLGEQGENGLIVGASMTSAPDDMSTAETTQVEQMFVQRQGGTEIYKVAGTLYDQLYKTPSDLRDKTVFHLAREEVTRLAYQVGDSAVELVKEGEGDAVAWQLKQPVAMAADNDKVDDLLTTLDLLRATSFVDEPGDLAAYGLAEPAGRVEVEQADGKQVVVLLGKAKDDGSGRFVKIESAPEVLVVRSSFVEDLETSPNRLRDLLVMEFDRTLVTSVALRQKNGDLVVVEPTGGSSWQVTQPEEQEADAGRVGVVLTALEELHADEWVADRAEDLADYGLDKPDVIATVRLKENGAERVETLYLAQDPSGGLGVFIKRKGVDTIYRSDSGLILSDLRKGPDDFKPFEQPDFGGGFPPM